MSLESVWVPRAKEPKTPTHLMSEKSGFENTGAAAARSELRVGETLVFESSMYRRADGKRALSGRRGRQASASALRTARLMR
jgi:hypothetical protein